MFTWIISSLAKIENPNNFQIALLYSFATPSQGVTLGVKTKYQFSTYLLDLEMETGCVVYNPMIDSFYAFGEMVYQTKKKLEIRNYYEPLIPNISLSSTECQSDLRLVSINMLQDGSLSMRGDKCLIKIYDRILVAKKIML